MIFNQNCCSLLALKGKRAHSASRASSGELDPTASRPRGRGQCLLWGSLSWSLVVVRCTGISPDAEFRKGVRGDGQGNGWRRQDTDHLNTFWFGPVDMEKCLRAYTSSHKINDSPRCVLTEPTF